MALLVFIFIICILIVLHEWGHFLVARLHGVRVEKFYIGFGPSVFKKKIKETEVGVALVPLGGYVKLAGDEESSFKGNRDEYLSQSPGIRARIILAGPLFNYLLSFLFFVLVFTLGFPQFLPHVGRVLEGFPAHKAGLRPSDLILEINGEKIYSWQDLQSKILESRGEPLNLKIKRDSKVFTLRVKPSLKEYKNLWGRPKKVFLLGITPSGKAVYKRYPLKRAVLEAGRTLFFFTRITLQALFYMFTGTLSLREAVTGPLGIYYITKEAVHAGISAVFNLLGLLSLSLAIFNLLPFPVLDGGHLLFLALERIRKKRISVRVEEWINRFAISILVLLVIFVFINDISRFVLR